MNPHKLGADSPVSLQAPLVPHVPSRPRRRWALLIGAALLLACGAAGAWWWCRPAPVEPPLPRDIQDAEVRQAIELARQEVLEKPDSADAWGSLALALFVHLFTDEADRCFAEAARLDPNNPMWPYARGAIALKRDPDRAVPFLRQASSLPWPEYPSAARLLLAETLLERRELDEAEKIFREERRRDPSSPRATFGLGLVALEKGDDRAAAELLGPVRDSRFTRKKATAQLAVLARGRGDPAAARLEKEAAALPNDEAWPDPLANETFRRRVGHRRLEREIAELEKEAGRARARGDLEEAAHYNREAAEIYLGQPEEWPAARALVGAGENLVRIEDFDRALPLLREAVRRAPDSPQAHYSLAWALYLRARRSPDSAEAKDWLGEVLEQARRATQLKSDHAQAYLIWGRALKHLGQPAAAVVPLRQGVACRPEMLELQLALGEALLETGQLQEAQTHLENARRLDPNDPRPTQALQRLGRKKG